jgi:cytochrome c-type biogenesis protein CcmF
MLRVWNMTLVILTFFLTIFGTFMTRSGVVQSVHAFGEDPELAFMFSVFMVALLVVSFGMVLYRLPLLRARHELDSWVSREAAFLANNWILLFSALFVLFATMFPTISESLTGERLTVGPPFFNKWMLPIGLALLALTGIGPLLAWRKSTIANLRQQFMWPVLTAVVVSGVLVALGVRVWSSGLCFALSAFVVGTMTQEFIRGARVRQGVSGSDIVTSAIGLVARNQRRYGGYIVHLGIVLMFLGFAGEGFKQEDQVLLKPGDTVQVGNFTVRHDAIRLTDDGQKQMITANMTVFEHGAEVGTVTPAKWFYRKRTEEPTTEVAIRRTFAEDLYVVLAGFDLQQQSATFHVVVNPLVNWIWAGFAILALGTIIALLPERTFASATATVPSRAATTSLLVIIGLALASGHAHAQHVETPGLVLRAPASVLERELQSEIVCMCGTCGRKRIGECTCGMAAEMRAELAGLVAKGMDRDQVYQYYIGKYGSQEPLAMPIDEGFNRLAWAVPYALGLFGAAFAGALALRWSRAREATADAPTATDGRAHRGEWDARLDEELRDLD